MRRLLAAVLLASGILVGPSGDAPEASAASPCPAGQAFLDFQAWWSDPGEAWPGRHAHVGACVAVNDVPVNGPTTYNLQWQTHAQPAGAEVTRVRVVDFCSGSSCSYGAGAKRSSGYNVFVQPKPLPQPDADGNLVATTSVTLDWSKFAAGRHELRFGVYVTQPNGLVQLVSSRYEVCVRTCSPAYRSLSQFPKLQGTGGWYSDDSPIGYADARITSPIPTGPVSSWALTGQCQDPSGAPITESRVALDMDAHHGDPGVTLFSSSGASKFSLNVAIPPGLHKVAIVCGANSPDPDVPGTNSGVIVATIDGG